MVVYCVESHSPVTVAERPCKGVKNDWTVPSLAYLQVILYWWS